ncbi:MAG TPA: hypothetical protein VLB86_13285 [Gaiellaceae bacterium]|nr:hypothetical protein [Gaiellaceae bacterium]
MPQPTQRSRRRLARLFLFVFFLASAAFVAAGRFGRAPRATGTVDATADPVATPEHGLPGWASAPALDAPLTRERRLPLSTRKVAGSIVFAVLFFAGASFSAVAGDNVASMLEGDGGETLVLATTAGPEPQAVEEAPAAEAAPAESAPADAAPATVPSGGVVEEPEVAEPAPPVEAAPAPEAEAAPESAPADAAEEAYVEEAAADVPAASPARVEAAVTRPRPAFGPAAPAVAPAPVPAPRVALDPEVDAENVAATVWLHRTLPDPTPPSLRLSPKTAARLLAAARTAKVDWAFVLAVVRADANRGQFPARGMTFAEAASRLTVHGNRRDRWDRALAYTGRTAAADRAVALAHYYRAVGIRALVDGLLARQDALAAKVLADERVDLYAGGRDDVVNGRIDVRVLALVEYLAESFGQVTVSSLTSGHRLFARPGVVSAHVYGQAVDVAALAGMPIAGHQQPGSVTERAVRDVLLLPAEMRPRQVISLLGLGGPSFPLANHDDHIHVGF